MLKYNSPLSQISKRLFSNETNISTRIKKNDNDDRLHVPVLLAEVIKHIVNDTPEFKTYLDMTFGAGGHSEAILKNNPNSRIFAVDRDPVAFELAKELRVKYPGRVFPLHGKFSDISMLLREARVNENSIDAALLDAGASSMQYDTPNRGFSISKDGPLDMRMNPEEPGTISAADVVNRLDEQSIAKILWKYGEEKMHKKIAHGIVFFRSAYGKIETTQQLADVIGTVISGNNRFDSLNRPTSGATKTFQALRIFVNNELNELHNGISQIHKFIRPNGRLAVISFHSLEDRIVKNSFNDVKVSVETESSQSNTQRKLTKKNYSDIKFQMNQSSSFDLDSFNKTVQRPWTPVNKKVILPTDDEIESNSRARSAKLRIALKNDVLISNQQKLIENKK